MSKYVRGNFVRGFTNERLDMSGETDFTLSRALFRPLVDTSLNAAPPAASPEYGRLVDFNTPLTAPLSPTELMESDTKVVPTQLWLDCPVGPGFGKGAMISSGTSGGSPLYVDPTIQDEGTLTVTVGGSVSGVIDFTGDHDQATVTLTAGLTYLISLRGTGGTPVTDTYLEVLNPSAVSLGHDDDGGNGLYSIMTITAATTGTYTIDASSFPNVGDPGLGSYTIDVRVMGADAVGATNATSVLIGLGTTFGFTETGGETDRYKVHLEAGKFYNFLVAGSADYENGANPYALPAGTLDTRLSLRSATGLLASNDDLNFPNDLSSGLGYYATVTGDYYLDVRPYAPQVGGYVLDFKEIDLATLNPLDSIDWQSANNVSFSDVGGVPTAYVYFAVAGENFGELNDPGTGPLPSYGWNAFEKQQFMLALDEYEHILGVNYVVTTDSSQADFRVITTTSTQYGAYFYPQDPSFGTQQGIGAFNVNSGNWDKPGSSTSDTPGDQISLERGGYAFAVILHELGHAHGQAHPHDNGGGSEVMPGVTASTGSYGVFNLNQGVYTVMSYNDAWDFHPDGPTPFTLAGLDNGWSATLGAFDIAELQRRYGVHAYNGGDSVYALTDVVDDANYQTIWDSGGTDTISYSGLLNATIDLTAATLDYTATGGGIVSYVIDPAPGTSPLRGGYTIANGVVIENATGGSGNDGLVGNSAANTLTGNNGNDNLFGRGGDDTLIGGAGTDTAYYDGNRADFVITANFVNGVITGYTVDDNNPIAAGVLDEGTDGLTGVEAIHFADVTFSIAGSVVLYDGSNNLVGVFTTIQAAVDAASNGYTIQASSGTYNETVTVDVDVTINGANAGTPGTGARIAETIIDGGVYMNAAGATLDGLTLLGGATLAGNPAGIYIDVDNVTLTNLIVTGDGSFSPGLSTPFGGGVTGLVISDSLIQNWDQGTYFNPSTQFTATGNTFDDNGNAIIGDDWAAGTFIEDNVFSNSVGSHIGYGVFASVTDMRDFVGDNDFQGSNRTVSTFAYGDGDAGGQTITGTEESNGFFASEYVAGSGTDSTFNGLGGNDTFYGGSSNDNLNGGSGNDTARYDGPSTDYTIVYEFDIDGNVIGFLEVTDNNLGNGNEGHDFLTSVEALSFDNVDIDLSDAVKVYNATNTLVGTFDNIQDAVDFSGDGYTITVASGTYVEQVVVDNLDNLTIKAEDGATVTIEAPADVVQTGTKLSAQGVEAILTVRDSSNFTLDGIDIDGNGAGNTVTPGNDFVGVFFRNSSGSVLDADITGIRDPYPGGTTAGGDPLVSGIQRGVGVVVNNNSNQSFLMTGGSISDFQKGGMSILHGDVLITGVEITGGGAQTTNAQNGIVLFSSTGTVDGNTITGIGYAGLANAYSGGVLAFGTAGLHVTNNTITGSNDQTADAKVVGVWFYDDGGATGDANSGGVVAGNVISYVDTGIEVDGDVTPAGIDINDNTITNIDLTDPYAAGVYHAPESSLATPMSVEGSELQDYLGGAAAADELTGLGGNDEFQGFAGDDNFHGDGGTDQADYDGNFADYTIVYEYDGGGNIVGFLEVTDDNAGDGDEGHDLMTSIETLKFADITLNLTDPVRLFDGTDNLVGTFTTIQDAIDAASDGYRIVAAAGTYAENLTVDKDVTIEGANVGLAGTDGGRGAETVIDGQVTFTAAGAGATLDGVQIVGDAPGSLGNTAVEVIANDITLVNSVLDGGGFTAIITGTVTGLDIGGNLIEGYSVGIYVSGSTTAGSIHDNLFQGDGPGSGTGLQEGVFLETSYVIVEDNIFDGIDGGSIFANPHGPNPVDLETILINNIITNSGAERPVQVLASSQTPSMLGTDFNEAFYDPNYGGPGEILASLSFEGRGGNDDIYGNTFGDTFSGGDGNDRIFGDAGDDTMSGDANDDLLDGGTGIDTALFANSLTYIDTVIGWVVASAEGTDVLQRVEIANAGGQRNLLVGSTGFASIQAASNAAQNGDIIRVASGTYGGTVTYDDANLVVIAQSGAVLNTTFSTVTANGISVYGGAGSDHITTGANSDSLDGGAGADVLTGGGGNDYYTVDQLGDQVIEGASGGYDIVFTKSSYTLGAGQQIESLGALDESGTGAFELYGNSFNNRIVGNDGSNSFNGNGGTDVFYGNGGNDYYIVDSADDVVIETAGDGSDIVFVVGAGFTLSLGSEVESIGAYDQSATTAMFLNGNELNNRMVGNNGSNSFDGGAGADLMYGNAGNDYYVVDNAGDRAIETAGNGYDILFAKTSYTLEAGQELESLGAYNPAGTEALNLTGNEFANRIVGNAGANTVNGGAGADVLYGEGGADVFAFTTALGGGNVDRMADIVSGTDKVALDDAVFTGIGPLGALNANAFVAGTAALDANDRIIYDAASGNLYFDADGNGAGAQVLFATVAAGTVLAASDFQVI